MPEIDFYKNRISIRHCVQAVLVVVVLITIVNPLSAQYSLSTISKSADQFFEKEQYYKSAQYYQVALGYDPHDPYLNFRLADSYREIFDYPMAEIYYQKTVDLDTRNYPLALFYHALMQKANGKFDQAITSFTSFLTFADKNANISLEDRSRYLEQAIVEREGCLLALEQLSYPYRDYDFGLIPGNINTASHDYAPAICADDPILTITSARTGTKGGLQDNRFGEFFTDNFRYKLEGEIWKSMGGGGDRFEVTNTKFSDGAGSYNLAGDKYYFTSCYEENATCKIYVSQKISGHWQKPLALNDHVNLLDFDTKHPSLSPSGDTLFFSSNRTGGRGMMDIWMSVSNGNDQWGPATNLGPQINTPFNEISPFFHPKEDILFFSSEGHEGLGGLDVLMVAGFHTSDSKVRNIGPPFNSSYDDAFFVAALEKGYLASNRPGGKGKFDIYQFKTQADESIMAELTEDGTVVDREELLRSRLRQYDQSALYAVRDEDQFYYDNLTAEEKIQLERILSAKMHTEGSFDPKLTLSKDDFKFYRKLSIEDKARIERMAQLRAYQAGSSGTEQETTVAYWAEMNNQRQQEDEVYYQGLDPENRGIVDRIIAAKLEDRNTFGERKLQVDEANFYQTLEEDDKVRINRLAQREEMNQKLQHNLSVTAINREYLSEPDQLETQTYFDGLSDKVKLKVDGILATQSKAEAFDATDLDDRELKYYNKLSPAEKERLKRLANIREVEQGILNVAKENETVREALTDLDRPEDRLYYENLSPTERALADRIIEEMIEDRTSFAIRKLEPSEIKYLEGLSLKDQIRIDRITQYKAVESIHSPLVTVNSDSITNADQLTNITGQLYDLENDQPAALVVVPLIDKADQVVQVDTTDENGRFEFVKVVMNRPYRIMGQMPSPTLTQIPRYAVQDLRLEPSNSSLAPDPLRIDLATINPISYDSTSNGDHQRATITGQLYDKDKLAVLVPVSLMDADDHVVQVDTTDENGRFEFVEVVMNRPYKIMGQAPNPTLGQIPKYVVQNLIIKDPVSNDIVATAIVSQDTQIIQDSKPFMPANTEVADPCDLTVASYTEPGNIQASSTSKDQLFGHIYFGFDCYEISSVAQIPLDRLVAAYQNGSDMTILVEGHTDSMGPAAYNDLLSRNRGQSAVDYLVSHGVDPDHISLVAKGEEAPIASNLDYKGRQLNRRVSFYINGTNHQLDQVRSNPGN